jgi:hypothetical protein
MEYEYLFADVEVTIGGGVLAYGTAYLKSSSEAYPNEFYVACIGFGFGESTVVINRSDIAKKRGLLRELSMAELIFNVVANTIENDPRAQEEWDEFRREG